MDPNCKGCEPGCNCADECAGVVGKWCDACAVERIGKYVEAVDAAEEVGQAYEPTDDEQELIVELRDLLLGHPGLVVRAFRSARECRRVNAQLTLIAASPDGYAFAEAFERFFASTVASNAEQGKALYALHQQAQAFLAKAVRP